MSSSNFFKQPAQIDLDMDWRAVLSEENLLIAEAIIVVAAMRNVEDRWRDLNEYIGSLLVEDFMDPKSYTMLLFDDETFSRSRLYFWIIGCLNEFDISIEDNIKQWKLFRQARIDPGLRRLKDILNAPERIIEVTEEGMEDDTKESKEWNELHDIYTRGEEV